MKITMHSLHTKALTDHSLEDGLKLAEDERE